MLRKVSSSGGCPRPSGEGFDLDPAVPEAVVVRESDAFSAARGDGPRVEQLLPFGGSEESVIRMSGSVRETSRRVMSDRFSRMPSDSRKPTAISSSSVGVQSRVTSGWSFSTSRTGSSEATSSMTPSTRLPETLRTGCRS